MRFPIIRVPFLPALGMALFPFILIKHPEFKHERRLIRHEKIHLIQQLELLIIPFYILYLLNYLINLARYRDHVKAYLNISFEREAYSNEGNSGYLKQRRIWSWLSHLK